MAVDYFLKIDGVPGESKDATHPNEIQLESWTWGETNIGHSVAGGGTGSGKISMQDFNFLMEVNKASPLLFQKCATGEPIPTAVLTCRKAGKLPQEYLKWTFSELIISKFKTGGERYHPAENKVDSLPLDEISFNFTKIQTDYKEQNPDGTLMGAVTKWYDLKKSLAG
jgi:type VI secretion system secreted protein Hcp